MPVSPTPPDEYYYEIARAYQQAELEILGQIRTRLERGESLDDIDWQKARLAEVQQVRKQAVATLARVNKSMTSKINGAFGAAYKGGEWSALKDASLYLPDKPTAVSSEARQASVRAASNAMTGGLATTMPKLLRQMEDDYARVINDAVIRTQAGSGDRRSQTGKALQAAFGRGLKTGPGGKMNLPDYVTMAMRTGVANTAIQGHLDTLGANGVDLVYIQPGPRHCETCDGWANKPLWRGTGPTGSQIVEDITTGEPTRVQVFGTLDQAKAAGWGHPNCRCNVGAYFPGATQLPTPRPKWDEEGYEAQQAQRAIERKIREWKTREALATTPEERAQAASKVKEWQNAQLAHMKQNPQLKRQYQRESIKGNLGPGGAPRTPPSTPPTPPKAPRTPSEPSPAPRVPPRAPEVPETPREVLPSEYAKRTRGKKLTEITDPAEVAFLHTKMKNAETMYGTNSAQHRHVVRQMTDQIDEDTIRNLDRATGIKNDALNRMMEAADAKDGDRARIWAARFAHLSDYEAALKAAIDKAGAGKPGPKFEAKFGADPGFNLPHSAARVGANPGGPGWPGRAKMIDDLPRGYGTSAYSVNCTRVAATYELRRRGYDVTAAPIKSDAVDNVRMYIEANWRDATGNQRSFESVRSPEELEKFALDQGVGARFFISVGWKNGGGHIFNAEVVELPNGTPQLRYYEAQTDDLYSGGHHSALKARYDREIDWNHAARGGGGVLRVDDLFPQDSLVERDWVRPVIR